MRRLIRPGFLLLVTMLLHACGGVPSDITERQGDLTPQLVLLPLVDDYVNNVWVLGNWHGTTGNPFPPYCPTSGPDARGRYCVYDVQPYQDKDFDDYDHVAVAGGFPPWGTAEAAADGFPEMFKVDSLRNELTN